FERPHVAINLVRVGQNARRSRHVAERGLRRRDFRRRGQVVGERRIEEGLGRVFAYLLRVLLVDGYFRIASGLDLDGGLSGGGERSGAETADKQCKAKGKRFFDHPVPRYQISTASGSEREF